MLMCIQPALLDAPEPAPTADYLETAADADLQSTSTGKSPVRGPGRVIRVAGSVTVDRRLLCCRHRAR